MGLADPAEPLSAIWVKLDSMGLLATPECRGDKAVAGDWEAVPFGGHTRVALRRVNLVLAVKDREARQVWDPILTGV